MIAWQRRRQETLLQGVGDGEVAAKIDLLDGLRHTAERLLAER